MRRVFERLCWFWFDRDVSAYDQKNAQLVAIRIRSTRNCRLEARADRRPSRHRTVLIAVDGNNTHRTVSQTRWRASQCGTAEVTETLARLRIDIRRRLYSFTLFALNSCGQCSFTPFFSNNRRRCLSSENPTQYYQ